MPEIAVLDMGGKQIDTVSLPEGKKNDAVLHDAIIMQQASMRRGTHDTKNRAEVRGGGRKPWRQKGTGRARHGSIRSPIWTGGGVTFGPTPRSYGYKLPKKVRRLALRSALVTRIASEKMMVIDKLELEQPKTRLVKQMLTKLAATNKVLLVVNELNDDLLKATRNLQEVKVVLPTGLNVLDIMRCNHLICVRDTVDFIKGVLSNEGSA